LILKEELVYAEAPVLAHAFGTDFLGPAIIHHGSEDQKREYLPAIARGEITFCEGFSEPEAGSDLAALQTRAEEKPVGWVINGVKRFTSTAHWADCMFLLARTDTKAPRHRGLSMFIFPMNTPGISIRPMTELTGIHRLNEVFLDNVRVPKSSLLGQKNRGWYQAMTTLDFERVGLPFAAHCQRILEYLVQYAKETITNGQSLAEQPKIRQELAQMDIEVEAARLLAYRIAWIQDQGIVPSYEASVSKVFCDELFYRLGNVGTRLLGLYSQLEGDSRWAPLWGKIERHYLTSFGLSGGGTQEIQRVIIATRGLGLPRD
jgi:alkylation response protein AidB-like acyl-CoA dehydrogenase